MTLEWIEKARANIGETEIKGSQHNPLILQWWHEVKRGGITTDEVPWCAAFVGAMLEESGIQSTRFESAASYANWGIELQEPIYGCVVVFTRNGGGHVGFVVGQTEDGRLLVLGGNQGDMVCIKAFPTDRVLAYRWPEGQDQLDIAGLPIGDAATSTGEA